MYGIAPLPYKSGRKWKLDCRNSASCFRHRLLLLIGKKRNIRSKSMDTRTGKGANFKCSHLKEEISNRDFSGL